MSKFTINLNNINKSFSRPVLKDLCLRVEAGEFISIMGASGSGKSTLLNIIGLIEDFDQGSYHFEDQLIKLKLDYAALRLESIGFIFQNYNLLDRLSGKENVLFPLQYGITREMSDISRHLVEEFQVKQYWDQKVNVLSGGEKQRLAIVRAMVRDPQLLLADEPSGNLDEDNSAIVLDSLHYIRDEGKAVILVTHNPDIAKHADTAYILRDGCLHGA